LRAAGGWPALRAAEGIAGLRPGVTVSGLEEPDKDFSFWAPERASFSFERAAEAEVSAFTKRCSRGSYVMEESLFKETTWTPDPPSITVRETRAGGVVATRLLLSASRGADFKVSHFCPCSAAAIDSPAPPPLATEKTPRSRFRGVLPFSSSGCMGTMPTVPFWRTKTAVAAR